MPADKIERIIDESSRKLLQSASPSVKFWAFTHVLKKDREDAVVQRTLAECERHPPRRRLLDSIREDGTWPLPGGALEDCRRESPRSTDPELVTVYNNLLRLLHLVTMPEEDGVDRALERLLRDQSKDGYLAGPMTHGLPQPHYNGFALYILFGFYKEHDSRVIKAYEWLMSMQRKDGGWNMPYLQDLRYLPEYQHMTMEEFTRLMQSDDRPEYDPRAVASMPSCHWTTTMALWGLGNLPSNRKDRNVLKGVDFLLSRFFKRNPHPNFYESRNNWTMMRYPNNKCGGLAALEVLTMLGKGPDDPRMERPIEWLLSERYRDGLWTESNRPHMEKDQWLTLGALEVLRDYNDNL